MEPFSQAKEAKFLQAYYGTITGRLKKRKKKSDGKGSKTSQSHFQGIRFSLNWYKSRYYGMTKSRKSGELKKEVQRQLCQKV